VEEAAVVSRGTPEVVVAVAAAEVGSPVVAVVLPVAAPVVPAVVVAVVGTAVVGAAVVEVVGVGVGTAGIGWSGAAGSGESAENAVPSHRVVPGASSTSSQGSRLSSVRLNTAMPSRYRPAGPASNTMVCHPVAP